MKPFSDRRQPGDNELPPAFGGSILYSIMDTGVQPQLLLTHTLQIVYPNKAFCKLAGCMPEAATGCLLNTFQQGKWYLPAASMDAGGWPQPKEQPGTPEQVTENDDFLFHWKPTYDPAAGATFFLLTITPKKAAQAPFHQATRAEKLADSLFEASPDCLKILDLDGHLVAMNTCGKALMEVDDFEQIRGAYWPAFWGPDEQLAHDALAVARKGGIGKFTASCATLKGTFKHWEVLLTPVVGIEGEVLQLIAVSRDVTKEAATRNELRRAEELARSLFDKSPDCLKLMDLDGNLVAFNESGRNLLFSQDGAECLNWTDMWAPGDRHLVTTAMQTAASGGIGHFAAPCTMPSGNAFWWEVLITPVRNEHGAIYQLIASCRDITERKNLEQQLANNALQKELALQAASMGTWSFDFDSDDMGMDERARELFGLAPGQKLSHQELFSRIHPDDRPRLQEVIETDILNRNAVSHVEYRLQNDVAPNRWVHACRRLFFDDSGKPVHCVGLFQDITQQKETELRLRKINQTLQLGIQVGKLAIAEVDYHTGQVSLSAEAAQLYGFASGTRQVSREQVHATFHPEEKELIFSSIKECLDPVGPGFMDIEHRVAGPGGSERWLRVRKQVFFDTTGVQAKPQYAIIAAQDITEQKEVAHRISQSEKRFKAIFNEAPVAIWEEDFSEGVAILSALKREGVLNFTHYCAVHPEIIPSFLSKLVVLDVNDAAVQLFGAANKAELISRLAETFLPESLEVFTQELIALASGASSFKGEAQMQTLQGHPIWVLLSVRFPQGSDFSSVLVTMTDITLQKKLEAEVGAHANSIQQILDSLPQKAWIGTPEGSIEYFSQQWYAYTGLDRTGSLGTKWQEATHPDDQQKLLHAISRARAEDTPVEIQVRLRNKAGVYRWHLGRAIALKNEDGSINRWVGTSTDIHEQRTAADLLEQAVAERTQALQESNKALQHTNKELEEFLYVASHDLQEPIRKIRTFTNLVIENSHDTLAPQLVHYLQRIEAAAQRMTSLIKGLLAFSSLRTNQPPAPCDLNKVAQEVAHELHWFIEQEDAVIEVQDLPGVLAVYHEVKQLLYNLVANALKFRKQAARPHIILSAVTLSEAQVLNLPLSRQLQQYVQITVADNGIGFHPQYAEKIFEVFQRLHNRSTYDGAGIGLALCRKIATKSGGMIWAEAAEGQGAAFHIVLPSAKQVLRKMQ